jgi:hypothetical protein
LFPRSFYEMIKGIVGLLGYMNIQIKLDAKPIKIRSYRLNPKYKEKLHKELD